MGLLDRFRAWIWKAEEASNELEYGAIERIHHAEDAVDERTHGRFYDTVEKIDEEADEFGERVHLDEPPIGGDDDDEPPAAA